MFELRIFDEKIKKKLMAHGKHILCLKTHYWHTFHENEHFAYKWKLNTNEYSDSKKPSYTFNRVYLIDNHNSFHI